MSYLYQNPLILVAVLTILLSPFILKIVSPQNKKTKQNLKAVFLVTLCVQILLGFFNWENFSIGKSGFELSLNYPESYLGFVFMISFLQIILLKTESFNRLAVVLNFINSGLVFIAMNKLSSILGFQVVSLPSVGTTFLILAGNIFGLALINKDKDLLKKYFGR